MLWFFKGIRKDGCDVEGSVTAHTKDSAALKIIKYDVFPSDIFLSNPVLQRINRMKNLRDKLSGSGDIERINIDELEKKKTSKVFLWIGGALIIALLIFLGYQKI